MFVMGKERRERERENSHNNCNLLLCDHRFSAWHSLTASPVLHLPPQLAISLFACLAAMVWSSHHGTISLAEISLLSGRLAICLSELCPKKCVEIIGEVRLG